MSEKIIHVQTVLLESRALELMKKAGNLSMKDSLSMAVDRFLGDSQEGTK